MQYYQIPQNLARKTFYASRMLTYYRRLLKAEANGEPFNHEVPDRNDMLDAYTVESEMSKSNNDFNKMTY